MPVFREPSSIQQRHHGAVCANIERDEVHLGSDTCIILRQ